MDLKPGRELDALVAEKVMGEDLSPLGTLHGREIPYVPPHYSTDIAAAWQVMEHITAQKRDDFGWFDLRFVNDRWKATFITGAYYEARDHIEAPTAPHAICLAALKAVGV